MLLKSRTFKSVASLLPLLAALVACGESQLDMEAKAKEAAFREKYAKAKSVFEERCKTAGVVINRTVKDVDGIELTKVRQPIAWGGREYFDPMYPEAAMASEYRGDSYVNQFLMTESIDKLNPDRRGSLNPPDFDAGERSLPRRGYRFVEIVDPQTHERFRGQLDTYPPGTNLWVKPPKLTPISKSATRYALDYEDLLNSEDRELWVAGTKLRVIDKQSGEVIAELTRYVWDAGFGTSTTGRWPWQHANAVGGSQACPDQLGTRDDISRKFVDTVIIPKQGD